jgi:hypothetical protein
MRYLAPWFLLLIWVGCDSRGDRPYHFREEWVPEYELPALLATPDGQEIRTRTAWEDHREDLLAVFRREIYGAVPADGLLDSLRLIRRDSAQGLWGGLADRYQYRVQIWR